ncbi:MAG: TIGR01906 family membrane protein [SAR202 cluster bacterium]|nr:TIGR01906 family membrane protein [SAR202 cluster bacterium]
MQLLRRVPGALFVMAVPLFLICASVAWAVNDPGVYWRGFQKHQVSLYTGIADDDLKRVGADIRRYFNSAQEPLTVRTRIFGQEQELFKEREVLHMRDVKRLFWGVYVMGSLCGIYLGAVTILGLRRQGRGFLPRLAGLTLMGGILTLGLAMVVGAFSLTGFSSLFLLFHQISFGNDLWQLDPATDYLLALFPLGFWFDVTMLVAALTVTGALALSAASGAWLYLHRQQGEQQDHPEPPANSSSDTQLT